MINYCVHSVYNVWRHTHSTDVNMAVFGGFIYCVYYVPVSLCVCVCVHYDSARNKCVCLLYVVVSHKKSGSSRPGLLLTQNAVLTARGSCGPSRRANKRCRHAVSHTHSLGYPPAHLHCVCVLSVQTQGQLIN